MTGRTILDDLAALPSEERARAEAVLERMMQAAFEAGMREMLFRLIWMQTFLGRH